MAALAAACGVENADDGADPISSVDLALCQGDRDKVDLYVPPPNPGALDQIETLKRHRRWKDAALIDAMIDTPQAVWFVGGTPEAVRQDVRKTVKRATSEHKVPVLVSYNIPFRDCAQFSAGGAATTDEYLAWIDAFAAGIGAAEAIVILEPDSLGIIPYNIDINGNPEWCQPSDADPATATAARYDQLRAAVTRLHAQPNVSVYLDGTHNRWLGTGDAAQRLVKAGVQDADGFFLNVSNFQASEEVEKYGTWISSCIAFANNPEEGGWRLGHYDWCASQYYPATLDDFSTWSLSDDWYAGSLGTAVPTVQFVIDTSRNGQGRWVPPAGAPAGDPQDWCNPPDRGAGLRPQVCGGHDRPGSACARTPLLAADLWVKIPGESDGQCFRWDPSGSPDPVRGGMDPSAGAWFPDMALELARNAAPPLLGR